MKYEEIHTKKTIINNLHSLILLRFYIDLGNRFAKISLSIGINEHVLSRLQTRLNARIQSIQNKYNTYEVAA